jgi:choline monooxygenase
MPQDALARFDADPEHSFTLPGSYYHDADVYGREMPAIFYRAWQYACHVSLLAEPGHYFVRDIGDQSVVVLRGDDGELRAFHNVCQHRAHRLLEGQGPLDGQGRAPGVVICPYHGWTYELGGALKYAPDSGAVAGFDKGGFCLSPVRIDSLCGFVFFNLDPDARPMAEVYAGLEDEIRSFSPNVDKLTQTSRHEYPMAANWKNAVENFSECYHCPGQHKGLVAGGLDLDSYSIAIHDAHHSHTSRGKGDASQYPAGDHAAPRSQEFGGWLIWPNLSLEVYPGGYLNIFHHTPAGPEKTVLVIEWYFADETPAAERQEVVDFMHTVRIEDIPICESVQRGLHSMGYSQGRFMVDAARSAFSEHAVHDFQLKVARSLGLIAA